MIPFRTTKSRRAFTLIELLIVITIIGILAVALIPKIANAPSRARDTQRKTDLSQVAIALEGYFQDYGSYPSTPTVCNVSSIVLGSTTTSWATYFNASDIPTDPLTTQGAIGCGATGTYYYKQLDSGMHYVIGANLENDSTGSGNVKYSTLSSATSLGTTGATGALYDAIQAGESCTTTTAASTAVATTTCVFVIAK